MGSSNSSLMILTSTCPLMCPDLSGGPPMAVQASRVTQSLSALSSAALLFWQMLSICGKQMNPVLSVSNSEMSLHNQNSSKCISNLCRTVSRSQTFICPFSSSSRSQIACRQYLISSSDKLQTISSILIEHYIFLLFSIEKSVANYPQHLHQQISQSFSQVHLFLTIKFYSQILKIMFDRFCRNNPCFLQQERACEIQVPSLSQLQHSINRLPTFQSQHPCMALQNPTKDKLKLENRDQKMQRYALNRVKSQPDIECHIRRHRQKENHQLFASAKHQKIDKITNQLSSQAYYNPFMNDSHYLPEKSGLHNPIQRTSLLSTNQKTTIPVIRDRSILVNPSKNIISHSHETTNIVLVSIEEYNRIINLNRSLIKMIEDDNRPLRAMFHSLEQQQRYRLMMIQSLERKVEHLKQQLGRYEGSLPIKRLY